MVKKTYLGVSVDKAVREAIEAEHNKTRVSTSVIVSQILAEHYGLSDKKEIEKNEQDD